MIPVALMMIIPYEELTSSKMRESGKAKRKTTIYIILKIVMMYSAILGSIILGILKKKF